MKILELDVYNGSRIKVKSDKNSNVIDINILSDYYVINNPNVPFDYNYNRLNNIFKINNNDYKIIDYTSMALKKNKDLYNELNIMIVKKDNTDSIYIVIRRAFTHQNHKQLDVNNYVFELCDKSKNTNMQSYSYRLPNKINTIKLGKTIDTSLIGMKLNSGKVEYIQCNSDSHPNYMNNLLKSYYNYNATVELMNKGSIVYLNSSNKSNKILIPEIPNKRTTESDFISMCAFYDNIYLFSNNSWYRYSLNNNIIMKEKI